MRVVAVLAVAAGCYQPSAATGVPCSPMHDCPGAQICDLGRPVPTCVDVVIDAAAAQPLDASPDGAPPPPLVCPAGYAAVGTLPTKYRQVFLPATWDAAAADCADDAAIPTSRTHLVVVSNEAERKELETLTFPVFWIGLSDRNVEDTFAWVTAEPRAGFPPATGSPWALGEPGGPGNSDCVIMTTGELRDDSCGGIYSYVCECDAFANDPARY